jgi:hypothetical protein
MLIDGLASHLRNGLVMLLALGAPAMAADLDEARAEYVAALVAAISSDSMLPSLSAALTEAEGEASAIREAQDQALGEALSGPRANLQAAETAARDLSAQAEAISLLIAQLTSEEGRLEGLLQEIAGAAASREAAVADLQERLSEALTQQGERDAAVAAARAELALARTAQGDFSELQTLAGSSIGLQDPRLRDFVWTEVGAQDLVRLTRNEFRLSAYDLLDSGGDAQFRLAQYSRPLNGWRFEEVPQGDAWLLWDARINGPLDLGQRRDNVFEQPLFLRIRVAENVLMSAVDLPPVELGAVTTSPWPNTAGSGYDACLDRLARASADAANRQICQTIFPSDARFDVTVVGAQNGDTTAVLLSGDQASAFSELYALHLEALRDLAAGNVPALLLPVVQRAVTLQAGQLARLVEAATSRLDVAETQARAAADSVARLQEAQAAAVAANTIADTEDAETTAATVAQLGLVRNELANLRAELAELSARLATANEAVIAAETAIGAVRRSVEADWESQRQRAEQAVIDARAALDRVLRESTATQASITGSRDRFLSELAASRINQNIAFPGLTRYLPEICLRLQNNSDHYAVLRLGTLRFRGQPFSRVDLLRNV